jgi:anti-sigma B factor antagonist
MASQVAMMYCFVVINFEEVEFLSSAFLGGLMKIKKAAENGGTKIKLCAFSKDILEVIKLVAYDKKFDIHNTKADAVKAFRHDGA